MRLVCVWDIGDKLFGIGEVVNGRVWLEIGFFVF